MRIAGEGRVQVLGADHPHSKRSCQWHTEWLKEVQKRKKKSIRTGREAGMKNPCVRERRHRYTNARDMGIYDFRHKITKVWYT